MKAMWAQVTVFAGAVCLAGCASFPKEAPPASAAQVAALEHTVQALQKVVNEQQAELGGMSVVPSAVTDVQAQAMVAPSVPETAGPPVLPVSEAPVPASASPEQGAGPFVNAPHKPQSFPARLSATSRAPLPSVPHTDPEAYAVYFAFSDQSTLERVHAFLLAHGLTHLQEVTSGQLAIYLGVYTNKRGALNRQLQIADETGLTPNIATVHE